jgi:ornithine cyclodeaminase
MSLLLLNEDELRQIVTISEAIDAVQTAFTALAEGRMNIPGDFSMNLPEVKGDVQVQGTFLSQDPYYVISISSYFQDNPVLNLPYQSGLTCVFDAVTGFPAAIMVDNGYLATIRAAAAGALATDHLANPGIEHVTVIGSGYRAYMQLKSLITVRQINTVSVWTTSRAGTDNYVNSMIEDYELDIRLAPSIEAAVRVADLIITVDGGHDALIKADWLKPGVHITSIGCNGFLKQELETSVLVRADVIITDDFEQCAAFGEIRSALAARTITKEDVQGDLGDLIIGKIPGRTHPDQITVADLTGLEVQDTVVATQALQKARFLGLGQRVAEPALSPQQ